MTRAGAIDGIRAPWYLVETPDGTLGWVFGGVLYPFDRDRPGPAYAEVWSRHLAAPPRSMRAEAPAAEPQNVLTLQTRSGWSDAMSMTKRYLTSLRSIRS